MRVYITICLSVFYVNIFAQKPDSTITVLDELTVVGKREPSDIHQLPAIVGTGIYAGKKSSLIVLDKVQGNIVTNTMRQVAGKIPGLFIWENESSGLQINIAARGLSPNRSWEFNIRQNGYDIAADPFGYPEAYYNPQLQSVQRIEFVRGHGALQYGAQLGGMVNYILKNGSDFNHPFQIESFQTAGSYGLLNSYQAVGGNTAKMHYYIFYDHRQSDGWRNNNQYTSNTGSASITYKITEKFSLTTEFSKWGAVSQQPGGLSDEQFKEDPQQSQRARNWFGLGWQTAALIADWKFGPLTKINFKVFQISGDRESVGFFPSAGIIQQDLVNQNTGEFADRTIDIDRYRNTGFEGRAIHSMNILGISNTFSAGIRFFRGNTFRYRGGRGTTAGDADFRRMPESPWNSDIDYNSTNGAIFAEDLISAGNRLMIIPGVRMEYLRAEASGYGSLSNGSPVFLNPQVRNRSFLLAGIGIEYLLTGNTRLYFNSTQSYRPVQFADLTTPPTTDVIDSDLTDVSGLNTDFGIRGKISNKLIFDVSAFNLNYNNRIGTIKQQRNDGSFYNLRTNVGSSRSSGIEAFTELTVLNFSKGKITRQIRFFTAGSLMSARYRDFKVISVVNNTLAENNFRNKKVEYAPDHIVRSGITVLSGNFSSTVQLSYTGSVFTDANNTVDPSANAQNGLIPSYSITDWSAQYLLKNGVSFRAGVNNIFDKNYFTRRASGYPGPGVLPGDGRTFFITVGYSLPDRH
ncbi:MAG: TonB-dependent receptor family protein [Cyclobacteriaceae bacterium]